MTQLEIFAEVMKGNYYFSDKTIKKKNHLEWNDDKTIITIYNDDVFSVNGVGDIGQAAELLGLCCTAYWDMYDKRLEIRVH